MVLETGMFQLCLEDSTDLCRKWKKGNIHSLCAVGLQEYYRNTADQ